MNGLTWFFPSWNGDFRLVETKFGTALHIIDPTAGETEVLQRFLATARKKGWTKTEWGGNSRVIDFEEALPKIAPTLLRLTKPKKKTLTAVRFSNGRLQVEEGTEETAIRALADEATKEKGSQAVTVTRPTPSCPQCIPGSIGPARETLLSFLDDEEHADWARARHIVVYGGLSGHRYLLAHRHSVLAQRLGRICYDLDDRVVVHFYDWSVPPEEEILAAKLILEHAEPWLRNEATLWNASDHVERYKNPFGDRLDGTVEASILQGAAGGILGALLWFGTKNGVIRLTRETVDTIYDAMADKAVLPFGSIPAAFGPTSVPQNLWGQDLY